MNYLFKEHILRNILVVELLILFVIPIKEYTLKNVTPFFAGDLLVAVSIISVIACFGNFEFKYREIDLAKSWQRVLVHLTIGLLMLVIGISLIFTSVLIIILIGHFILMDLFLVALYLACVGHDTLDLLRIRPR